MNIHRTFIIVFLIFSVKIFAIRPDSSQIGKENLILIDSIKITGNEITETFIITRELTFKPGDKINPEILDYNRERVFSLGIFELGEANEHGIVRTNFKIICGIFSGFSFIGMVVLMLRWPRKPCEGQVEKFIDDVKTMEANKQ